MSEREARHKASRSTDAGMREWRAAETAAQSPTVSVAMTVHNSERYLAQAVESILQQTYRDYEFVIIDDGSTDGSRALLERFAELDGRIRLVSRPNAGISRSRNEALARSRGAFMAIMDSDDVAHPNRLEAQLRHLRDHEDVLCVGSWYNVIDGAGRLLTQLRPPTDNTAIQALLLKGHTAISQPAAMLRREAVERVGGFDESLELSEDLDLYLKLGEIGELANLPQTLLSYRLHENSICSTARDRSCSRMSTARSPRRTRSRPASTTPASVPSTPGSRSASAPSTPPPPTPRRSRPSSS